MVSGTGESAGTDTHSEQDVGPDDLGEVIEKYRGKTGATIRVMNEAQDILGYLSKDTLRIISVRLGVPLADIYGIATFYSCFRTSPPAKHKIISCQGTACYVSGGGQVLEEIERRLGVRDGQTTPDGEFSVESVRCIGACALAPVIKVDSDIYSRVTPGKVKKILSRYNENREVEKK